MRSPPKLTVFSFLLFSGSILLFCLFFILNLQFFFNFFQTSKIHAQALPDLIPTSFSACYQPKAGDPNLNEIVATAKERNNGSTAAGSHLSEITGFGAPPGSPCNVFVGTSREVNITGLAPGQEVSLINNTVIGTYSSSCGAAARARVGVDNRLNVIESDELNNWSRVWEPMPACPISCSASFNPSSGTVVQGLNFDLQGRVTSISGGNGSGYDFMWARKYSYGNYLYPPTVNPTLVGKWYPGRWSSAGQTKGTHYLVMITKNKDKSWNYAVTCGGQATVTVK